MTLRELLGRIRCDRDLANHIEQLTVSSAPDLAQVRRTLEAFVAAAAARGVLFRGVVFDGDRTSFGQCLHFLRNMEWITTSEEQFIAALYGLLSDAAVHPGRSSIDQMTAAGLLAYVVRLVADRMLNPIPRPVRPLDSSAARYDLASDFLYGLRTGSRTGKGFDAYFDHDLMDLARRLLRPSDIVLLASIGFDPNASDELRNRCFSLMLTWRCLRDREERARVVRQLHDYYESNPEMPWLVARAIALALANRSNSASCILHYVGRIQASVELVVPNLAETDRYYRGRDTAIRFYLARLRDASIPTSGCVWEATYLSHRATSQAKRVAAILRERLVEVSAEPLRSLWQDAVVRVEGNAG